MLAPRQADGVQHYEVPVPDFTFSVYATGDHRLTTASAEVLFAIDGPLTLSQGDESLTLTAGQSAFIPAATGPYRVQAQGRFARAGNQAG